MRPVLFNTEMVRAILDGRKTVTRRVARPQPNHDVGYNGDYYFVKVPDPFGWFPSKITPPYRPGDILYVRETDVRVERLQEIDDEGVVKEGLEIGAPFDELWDSTIKPADRALSGWAADPWVWVIEFERCEKPKGSDDCYAV